MSLIGPQALLLENASGITAIPIASQAVVYTKAVKLSFAAFFALSYKCASSGTVNLKIEIEQSYKLPTTEGAADDYYAVPENTNEIDAGVTDTDQHHISLSPVAMKYVRFKITGLEGNDASTTIQLYLSKQEDI